MATLRYGRRWRRRSERQALGRARRYGNEVYLTEERGLYITADTNHPELELVEQVLNMTLQQGKRRHDALNPQTYRYSLQSPIPSPLP